MLTRALLSLCMLSAFVLLGCGNTDTANSNSASTNKPATTTASSSGDKIGVPECDDYIAKYDACVSSKVPEATRAQFKASFDKLRESWKQLAANPQTKAGLVQACKMASDQAKTSMKSFGCDF